MRVLLLILVIFYTLNPLQCWACTCLIPLSIEIYHRDAHAAKAIFLGQVTKIDILDSDKGNISQRLPGQAFPPRRVYFRVSEAWEGVNSPNVIISTPMRDPAECEGYKFEIGKTYLIITDYASISVDSHCSNTRLIEMPVDAAMDEHVKL